MDFTKGTRVAIGSDHGGFELKEAVKAHLTRIGYEIVDMGCHSPDPVDYPDIAFLVASAVATNDDAAGIMVDGVGVASAMVGNKVPGVRAAPVYDVFSARSSREHNDANMITLGGRVTGPGLACLIAEEWLATPFGGGRHERRVNKIRDIEARFIRRVPLK